MTRNSTRDLRSAQVGSLLFAALLIAVFAASTHASGVTNLSKELQPPAEHPIGVSVTQEESSEETIRVPIWIPGFDDVEPSLTCSRIPMPNLMVKQSSDSAHDFGGVEGMRRFGKLYVVDSCDGLLRTLPWILPPAPTAPIQVLLPMV